MNKISEGESKKKKSCLTLHQKTKKTKHKNPGNKPNEGGERHTLRIIKY